MTKIKLINKICSLVKKRPIKKICALCWGHIVVDGIHKCKPGFIEWPKEDVEVVLVESRRNNDKD